MGARLIVVGIGQALRGDDGAGPAVLHTWLDLYPDTAADPAVAFETLATPGLDLLATLSGYRAAILIDALQSTAPVGSRILLSLEQLDSFSIASGSAHGWGVAETLSLGRTLALTDLPAVIRLLAICGTDFSLGASLSPAVSGALPQAAAELEKLVQELLAGGDS